MTPDEVTALLSFAHETRGIEFKASGSLGDSYFAAKIVRAMLGMANRRNGGYVLVGVSDDHDAVSVTGLADDHAGSWNHDDLADVVAKYADPSIEFESLRAVIGTSTVFAIKVSEFEDVPIFCRRDYPNVLQKRLYVRSKRKPETTEVGTAEDLREIIDMAVDKQIRIWLRRGVNAGVVHISDSESALPDKAKFDEQLRDLR